MSATEILVIVGGFVAGWLFVSYLARVLKDAKEMERQRGQDPDERD